MPAARGREPPPSGRIARPHDFFRCTRIHSTAQELQAAAMPSPRRVVGARRPTPAFQRSRTMPNEISRRAAERQLAGDRCPRVSQGQDSASRDAARTASARCRRRPQRSNPPAPPSVRRRPRTIWAPAPRVSGVRQATAGGNTTATTAAQSTTCMRADVETVVKNTLGRPCWSRRRSAPSRSRAEPR
jgi:hypothetical protein